MWRQLASASLLILISLVFLIPELIVLPNVQAGALYWPYLMSMLAASFVVYATGRQANKKAVKLQIFAIPFEYWAFILAGLSLIVYCMAKAGIVF